MPANKSPASAAPRREGEHATVSLPAWLLMAVLLGGSATLIAQLPASLVLPAVSTALVGAGFALAAGLYLSGYRIERGPAGAWALAGALVFLGFAAALLADSEQALAVFDQLDARRATALAK